MADKKKVIYKEPAAFFPDSIRKEMLKKQKAENKKTESKPSKKK